MSTFLRLDNVSVRFRVYGVGSQSLKKQIISFGTGGRLARDAANHFVVQALENISLDLKDGDRLGIIGANGSGKSTLLRTMAGIYRPNEGSVSSQGRLSAIIDNLGLEPLATGLENIAARAALMRVSSAEFPAYADRVREICELGDYLSMPVHTYSSGMMMRLNFALSISIDPDILILDEWLSVADASFRRNAETLMRNLVARSSILVIASHNTEMLQRLCNRGILLHKGAVTASGNMDGVVSAYTAQAGKPHRAEDKSSSIV
jgi:lipopolysaccharide transport system ATP-binding protein